MDATLASYLSLQGMYDGQLNHHAFNHLCCCCAQSHPNTACGLTPNITSANIHWIGKQINLADLHAGNSVKRL